MNKISLFVCLIATANLLFAQTNEVKKVDIQPGQTALLGFDYANLINVRGWSEGYIEIRSNVLINMGKNDSAWFVETEDIDNGKKVTGYIQDRENLPEMITIRKDGQTYYFDTDDSNSSTLQKFYEEHGRGGYEWMSHGVAWEIEIEIMIPKNIILDITSKHGLIDIENFTGQVVANSKHGGIDIAMPVSSANHFDLNSRWGEIYTNLDFKYDKKLFPDGEKWNYVVCSLNGGKGALIKLQSKHGNLYLRKGK
jgi:hypothetical protein